MNASAPAQTEMEGVMPELDELQKIALTLSEAEVSLEIARDRYRKLEEELRAAMVREKCDRVVVRDSLNYEHTFTPETKETLRHKKKVAKTLVKANDDEGSSPE